MERYTKRLQNGVASWAYPNDCYGDDEVRNKVFKSVHRQNACEKLAAIEDILGDEYDLDRLRELAEADREGKIPKYTIDDTIYDRFGDAWEVTAVELRLLAGEPKWIYRCGIGTNDYCALWEFEVLTRAEAEAALRRAEDE